jgi:hypothetical protein
MKPKLIEIIKEKKLDEGTFLTTLENFPVLFFNMNNSYYQKYKMMNNN